MVNHDEDLDLLQYNLNSIFCVENSPLLNDWFRETVSDLNDDGKFLMKPDCEIAKARCTDCQILRCKSKRSCCMTSAECLLNPNCLKVNSNDCDESTTTSGSNNDPKCMRGNTYKLTLTPDFDFDKNNFFCHLRRQKSNPIISGRITLVGLWPKLLPPLMSRFEESFNRNNLSAIPNLNISLVSSSLAKFEDIIFERRGYEFFVYRLKRPNQFRRSKSKVYEHFSNSYVKVQFVTPFLFTTETWSKETCQVNTSHIYSSQPIHDELSITQVKLAHKPIKGFDEHGLPVFDHVLTPLARHPTKIRLSFLEKSSLLGIFFCDRLNQRAPSNISFEIELGFANYCILHIKGTFVGVVTFITVRITDTTSPKSPLFNSDIVASNTTQTSTNEKSFSISLLISIPKSQTSLTELHATILHCQQMIEKKAFFLKAKSLLNANYDDKVIESHPRDISNFLLTFFLSILGVCFVYFMLLAFQALRRSSRLSPLRDSAEKKRTKRKLNYVFFIKAIVFLTLKLFYTVSFTLSLVLSVCLTLNTALTSGTSDVMSARYVRNTTMNQELKNLSCYLFEVSRPSKGIVTKVRRVLINNDYVRLQSGQSTQNYVLSVMKVTTINRTKTIILELVNSIYLSVDRSLKMTLGEYIRVYDRIKYAKWLSLPRHWNNSITMVAFQSQFKDDYLRTFNLLRIYPATAALENCAIFRQRINKWQLSRIDKNIEIITNISIRAKSPLLLAPLVSAIRFFASDKRSFTTETETKSRFRKGVSDEQVLSLEVLQIRLVFMIIDTVLILYRFYWTYFDIQQLWRSKKEIIHFNQISVKNNPISYSDRAKSSAMQWTKQHHLECLVSGHLVIAAIIIIVSVICTNLIVLLTSKDHANWLSRKTGNIVRLRSLKMMKERLAHFNAINIVPAQRHWEHMRVVKMKEIMMCRGLSTKAMMNLELFFNRHYFSELCHFQKIASHSEQTINFCSSIIPTEEIDPGKMCNRMFNNSPPQLSFDFSVYSPAKTINYVNTSIHFSVHVLAIIILIAAIVGILKIIRTQMGPAIFKSSSQSTHIIYLSHEQYQSCSKGTLKMKVPVPLASIYNAGLNPHQHYQCGVPRSRQDTAF